ncbi:MAG TPA: DUF1488 family protein [Herminiimonas sp.]|jgi:hypothetical protein|nr:DUF1488 family protein [Herminiimonas sp.]
MTTASVTEDLKAVQFAVSYEGHPIPAKITAAALQRISSGDADSPKDRQLLDTFLNHQEAIEAMALQHVEQGAPRIELTAGCFN